MPPLLETLSLPFRLYEGVTHEDATLAICTPMLIAVVKCPFVSRRQDA